MSSIDDRGIARAVFAAQELARDRFTAKDLIGRGANSSQIASAIRNGYIRRTGRTVRTGSAPASLLTLTPKGRRAKTLVMPTVRHTRGRTFASPHRNALSEAKRRMWAPGGSMRVAHERREAERQMRQDEP